MSALVIVCTMTESLLLLCLSVRVDVLVQSRHKSFDSKICQKYSYRKWVFRDVKALNWSQRTVMHLYMNLQSVCR